MYVTNVIRCKSESNFLSVFLFPSFFLLLFVSFFNTCTILSSLVSFSRSFLRPSLQSSYPFFLVLSFYLFIYSLFIFRKNVITRYSQALMSVSRICGISYTFERNWNHFGLSFQDKVVSSVIRFHGHCIHWNFIHSRTATKWCTIGVSWEKYNELFHGPHWC